MAQNLALADVSTEDLLRELSHRLECTRKPEKRLILIGEQGIVAIEAASTELITDGLGVCDAQVLLVAGRALSPQGSSMSTACAILQLVTC
jgi:hypothetical protein